MFREVFWPDDWPVSGSLRPVQRVEAGLFDQVGDFIRLRNGGEVKVHLFLARNHLHIVRGNSIFVQADVVLAVSEFDARVQFTDQFVNRSIRVCGLYRKRSFASQSMGEHGTG